LPFFKQNNVLIDIDSMDQLAWKFWSFTVERVVEGLGASPGGLTFEEARRRLALYGRNHLKLRKRSSALRLLLSQFKSPLIIILLLAAVLSFFLSETVDAMIIMGIVLLSGLLGFWQEKKAADAVERLLAIVQISARVLRDGAWAEAPVEEIVPGDIALLNAGNIIPGDCLILDSKDLFVDEAALTGESFPAEKRPGVLAEETPLGQRTNSLFMGTHVISGDATAVVVRTGAQTEFGQVSERLSLRPAESEFERGARRFGYLLTEVTFALVVIIFGVSVYLARPVLDSFLFAVAMAVGLIPELLPAIVSINLAIGAERMARRRVIVKQLASIENFGSMNVLCSDKTGTLTEGVVKLQAALDAQGKESEKVLFHAYLNASYETGFTNPIDETLRGQRQFDLSGYQKLDEVPYDFIRKRLSILVAGDGVAGDGVAGDGKRLMVTKGAFSNVLEVCSYVETSEGTVAGLNEWRERIERRFEDLSEQGFRTLGVAYRDRDLNTRMTKEDETGMTVWGSWHSSIRPRPESSRPSAN